MFGEASKQEFQPNFSFSAFEIGHLFSRNINYNINSLLRLRVGACLIDVDERFFPEVEMKTIIGIMEKFQTICCVLLSSQHVGK